MRAVKVEVNEVIEPRFDRLISLFSRVNQTHPDVDSIIARVSSSLEFLRLSLSLKLDVPMSLADDDSFLQLDNDDEDISRAYNSLGLDFMLPASGSRRRSVTNIASTQDNIVMNSSCSIAWRYIVLVCPFTSFIIIRNIITLLLLEIMMTTTTMMMKIMTPYNRQ